MQLKIGYLFQCPPRAPPWVLRRCPLAPCKGKSLEYMLLYNQFYLEFARNYFSFKSFADFSKSALISSNSGFLF